MPERPHIVWMNGRLVPQEEAAVPVAAHGVLYGDGVFETVRAYGGEAFRLDRHLERLFEGAAVIDMPLGWGPAAITDGVRETLAAAELREAAVRITALRGLGPPGPDPSGCEAALLYITARAYQG